jgi:hypothetical protein
MLVGVGAWELGVGVAAGHHPPISRARPLAIELARSSSSLATAKKMMVASSSLSRQEEVPAS